MAVTLDIATKIVSPQQLIWSVFPGLGRRFLGQFIQDSVIFLDTPALRLSRQALKDDHLLRQAVAMSMAWRDYYRGAKEQPPSRDPRIYDPPRGGSFNAMAGNVRNVFVRMKPDDLVLVGQYDFYESIYIGEIDGDFDAEFSVHYERRYGRENIPARRVRWLPVRVERRQLSRELSRLLSNRKAVVSVERNTFGDEVFRIAYGDYVSGEDSRYIFEGPRYKKIAVSAVPGINLITYFAAAFNACELDEIAEFSTMSIQVAIDNYFEQDILYSFEIDFHSPGEYVLHAKRAALPLLVATLVSATSGDISLDDARSAEVRNTAATATTPAVASAPVLPDACTLEIQEKYKAIMESINADRFKELCKLNQSAQDGVGLKVRVKRAIRKKQ